MTARRRDSPRFPDGYDPGATRAALVSSALALFGEHGYAGTSVQAVTDGAGVTKGAFYHHFDNKEDVLRVIHDEFVDQQLEAMDAVLAAHDDPSDQLRQLLVEFLASTARYRANVAVFFQERRYLTGERFEAVMAKRHRFDRTFTEVIERGMATGRFRDDLDQRVVGFGLLGMCAWTHQWFRPEGALETAAVATAFAEMILDGLRADVGSQL